MPDTQIAVTEPKVIDWATRAMVEVLPYRARTYNEEAFKMSFVSAILENKDLTAAMSTDAGRLSVRHALRRAAGLGLSLNPQEGKACLVPYSGKIQYQIMKEGYIDLLMSTGAVKFVRVGTVYANDGWESFQTNNGDEYRWSVARGERGAIDKYFAAATLKDGTCILKEISAQDAIEHRKAYSPHSQLKEREYGEKTVAKMLCKTAKIDSVAPLMAVAIEKDEETIAERDVTPEPHKGASADDITVPPPSEPSDDVVPAEEDGGLGLF